MVGGNYSQSYMSNLQVLGSTELSLTGKIEIWKQKLGAEVLSAFLLPKDSYYLFLLVPLAGYRC